MLKVNVIISVPVLKLDWVADDRQGRFQLQMGKGFEID